MKAVRDVGEGAHCVPLAAAEDVDVVGAKAQRMSALLARGASVPPGIVITDAAFQHFLDHNELRGPIAEIVAGLSLEHHGDVRDAARAITELVTSARVPAATLRAVEARIADVPAPWIVRSSARGEDASDASFAGQLDSFPGIARPEDLEAAVLRCWASYWSERALAYQLARHRSLAGMGVVVQRFVDARLAGVMFTRAPIASAGDTMAIEYCHGAGEALVSGRVTPGLVLVDRESGAIASHAPPASGAAAADELIALVAKLGRDVERWLGAPQDIEWVVDESGAVHVVQARPITTLPAPSPAVVRERTGRGQFYSNANVNENYPEPVSPLLYSIASRSFYHYFRNLGTVFGIRERRLRDMERPLRNIIASHGARIYYNLTSIYDCLRQAPFGDALVASFDGFVGVEGRDGAPPPAASGRAIPLLELPFIALKTAHAFATLPGRVAEFEATVDRLAAECRATPRDLARNRALFTRCLTIRFHEWTNASLADAAAMMSYGALGWLLRRFLPGEEYRDVHNSLLRGLPDLASSWPIHDLWKLSRTIRADAALASLFERESGPALERAVADAPSGAIFRAQLVAFLDQWGFRCSRELMLTMPSYREEPVALLELLKGYALVEGPSPAQVIERQADERRVQTKQLADEMRRRPSSLPLVRHLRPLAFSVLLRWTQAAVGFRERVRLKQALLYNEIRRVVLAIGAQLAAAGDLQTADDVFFLEHDEIDRVLSRAHTFSVSEIVAARKAEHARLSALDVPDTMTLADGESVEQLLQAPHADATPPGGDAAESDLQLRGLGACGGRISAPARVLHDVTEADRLGRGEILVTRQTDPGWGPVFFLIRGLVIERGGMLSRGAIIAREFGIPAVVGIRDATKRIPDGEQLTVDGDHGLVSLGA